MTSFPERTVGIYINGGECHLGERLTEDVPEDSRLMITLNVWREMRDAKFVRLLYSDIHGSPELEFCFRPQKDMKTRNRDHLERLIRNLGGVGDGNLWTHLPGFRWNRPDFRLINQEEWNAQKAAKARLDSMRKSHDLR